MISLHLDNGDHIFDPAGDSQLGTEQLVSWRAMFMELALEIPADGTAVLFASIDVDSFLTIDNVLLAAEITSPEDIYIAFGPEMTEAMEDLDAEFPLSSSGGPVTDGMLAHQIILHDYGETTIIGQTMDILMLDFDIPGNGCLGDTLNQISVINDGTAGEKHISGMYLWADDGNGLFDPPHDINVAVFEPNPFSPGEYFASKLSVPLSAGGRRFFISIDLHDDFESGATIIPGKLGRQQAGLARGEGCPQPRAGCIQQLHDVKETRIPDPCEWWECRQPGNRTGRPVRGYERQRALRAGARQARRNR
jgi:hypothetical protein